MTASEDSALVTVDTTAGSRSFNRFEFQLSQTLHMAIELYDTLNYLLVLDYYDDITLFDMDSKPLVVSYYQVKTSNNEITIDSAIEKGWISKLYAQLGRPEGWSVKELGLITNTPLEISYDLPLKDVSTKKKKRAQRHIEHLTSNSTAFTALHKSVQNRIIKDIANKQKISESDVDLTKFAHIRTVLTIEQHGNMVEKEMVDFLYEKYPRITVDTVKGIYSSMISLLTKKQTYESLPKNASFDAVKAYKGIQKDDFKRVIDKSILLSLPPFEDVFKYAQVEKELENILSLAYVKILTDTTNRADGSFPQLFSLTTEAVNNDLYNTKESVWEYALRIGENIREKNHILCIPYDSNYIAVLIICLLINESRK